VVLDDAGGEICGHVNQIRQEEQKKVSLFKIIIDTAHQLGKKRSCNMISCTNFLPPTRLSVLAGLSLRK